MIGLGDVGIVIDCSHGSAVDLDCRIIEYATMVAGYRPAISVEAMRSAGQWEPITWEADNAVTHLNDTMTDDNVAYVIEDNSLYIEAINETEG